MLVVAIVLVVVNKLSSDTHSVYSILRFVILVPVLVVFVVVRDRASMTLAY